METAKKKPRPNAAKIAAEVIKEFEGFENKPYLCPANIPTIGYGWTDPNQRTDTIHVWETTIDESVWIARLLEYGIVPDIDEQGNLVL